MKSEFPKLAIFGAFIIVAGSPAGLARSTDDVRMKSAVNVFEVLNETQSKASFAWGEHTAIRTIETQTMFIRHTATEVQRRVAEKNAKTYYAHLAPTKKDELNKKKIHYLAVPTVRSKQTSPKAEEVLMIWDIPRESLVGQNVYELDNKPPVGTLASYDNLRAEYVGELSGGL